ncbi:MAG: hypothetical protein ACRBCS_03010 [Cellvibrionaceae bacterium]
MSTFAVFGMTDCYARKLAEKNIPQNINGIPMTLEQTKEAIKKYSSEVMASKKVVRLSQKFDFPQAAKDYINITKAAGCEYRDLHIKTFSKEDIPQGEAKTAAQMKAKWKVWEQ